MKKLIASLTLFIAVAICSAQEVSIASYNMYRLGHGTKDYALLASVVDDFDLVGAIEVMNEKGMIEVTARLPEGWTYAISPYAVGTKAYKEYFGFFYNSSTVGLVRHLGYYQGEGFMRPPYGIQFISNGFSFNLVIAHIVFGDNKSDRIAEIMNLGKVYAYFEGMTDNRGMTIIAGDFNEESIKNFSRLLDIGVSEMTSVGKTTFGKTELGNDYDHIFISSILVPRIVKSDVWYWTTDWSTRKTVSDHFPVYCIMKTNL